MFWHHMAIRNNGSQKEHSIQAMVGVALKMEIGRRCTEKSLPKKKNPSGPKGKPWTCHYCGSEYHFIGNCDKRKKEAKIVEDGFKGEAEDGFSWIAVLEEVKKNPEKPDIANVSLALICEETDGKGVLDCACTSPVAGENWVKEFIKGLSEEDKKNIVEEKSAKTFNIGGGEVRSCIKCVTLPVEVAGVKGTITTDVVKACNLSNVEKQLVFYY